jgi:hypothetical protein
MSRLPTKTAIKKNPTPKPVNKIPTPEVFHENNFFHEHALTVVTIKAQDGIACNVCNTILHDEVYGYNKILHTKFYMHKTCVDLPKTIYHPSHRVAPFNLRAHTSQQGEIVCKCCGLNCDSFHYHSSDDFNLHVHCAATPYSAPYNQNTSLHLRYDFPLPTEHLSDKCTICHRQLYTHWVYHSEAPKITAHLRCVRKGNGSTAVDIQNRLSGLAKPPSRTPPPKSLFSRLFG